MCVLCIGTANALVIADADGPYTGNEGSPITLDSSGSFIGGGSVLGSMSWAFGYGSNNSSEINPSHIYLDSSSYGITLYVNSTTGENDTDTTSAVINNVAPTVGPINDIFTESSSLVELMVSFSDPGILDNPWDFEFHWGDGFLTFGSTNSMSPIFASHIYTGAIGTIFTGNVRITDKDGGRGERGFITTITAVVPIPASVWLFGSGLLGLVGMARRKTE